MNHTNPMHDIPLFDIYIESSLVPFKNTDASHVAILGWLMFILFSKEPNKYMEARWLRFPKPEEAAGMVSNTAAARIIAECLKDESKRCDSSRLYEMIREEAAAVYLIAVQVITTYIRIDSYQSHA